MHQVQYYDDPSVPGCCCRMPSGARGCAIADIVLCVLGILGSIYNLTKHVYAIGLPTVMALVAVLICSVFVIIGARQRCHQRLLPYVIAKPIQLSVYLGVLIYEAVSVNKLWNQVAGQFTGSDYDVAYSVFKSIIYAGVGLGVVYVIIGIIFAYVVTQSYRYLRTNPQPLPQVNPGAVAYAYPNAAAVMNQGYGQPQQPQPYGVPQQNPQQPQQPYFEK